MLTISSSNFFTAAAFFFITPIVDVTFTTFSESILPNAVRAYSRKYGHARDFSEKEQKRAKYLNIWAKMYKIWKYFEKGHVIACNYRTQ